MQATESCAQKLVVLGLVGPESIVVANSSWTGLAGAATYFSLAASDYGLQASVITHTEPGVTDAFTQLCSVKGTKSQAPRFSLTYSATHELLEFELEPGAWNDDQLNEDLLDILVAELEPGTHLHVCPVPASLYKRLIEKLGDLDLSVSLQLHFGEVERARANLLEIIPSFETLFMNRREAALLSGMKSRSAQRDFFQEICGGTAVITERHDVEVWDERSKAWTNYSSPEVENVVDSTGAGDSFAGAFVASSLLAVSLDERIRNGFSAAVATGECRSTSCWLPTS